MALRNLGTSDIDPRLDLTRDLRAFCDRLDSDPKHLAGGIQEIVGNQLGVALRNLNGKAV